MAVVAQTHVLEEVREQLISEQFAGLSWWWKSPLINLEVRARRSLDWRSRSWWNGVVASVRAKSSSRVRAVTD